MESLLFLRIFSANLEIIEFAAPQNQLPTERTFSRRNCHNGPIQWPDSNLCETGIKSLSPSLSLKGERISIRLAGFHFREIRAYLIASFLLEMLNTELPT